MQRSMNSLGVSLPHPLTALLGRDADLQTLQHWLADPARRLITLTGPGGAGKTRLVLELARAISAAGSAHVVFVSLASIRDPSFVASAIAEALGLSDIAARDLPKRARAACHDRATLLVVDNFEHVLDAAPLIADLLTSIPPLRVLVTSRAPLRLRGEQEYAVGALKLAAGCEGMPPADLARIPAVRLFIERVRDVQPDFRLTAANGPAVTEICRRLDALPLALELAAPWLKVPGGRGSARTTHRQCSALDCRFTRSPRTSTDDECDGCLELSAADLGRAARVPPFRRASGPVSHRRGRGGAFRS